MHAFWCALLLVSLVFGEVFFAGSASLHDWFLHFLGSAYRMSSLVCAPEVMPGPPLYNRPLSRLPTLNFGKTWSKATQQSYFFCTAIIPSCLLYLWLSLPMYKYSCKYEALNFDKSTTIYTLITRPKYGL